MHRCVRIVGTLRGSSPIDYLHPSNQPYRHCLLPHRDRSPSCWWSHRFLLVSSIELFGHARARCSLTNSLSNSYTYLLVAADQTTLSATRITSLAGFVSTLTAAFSGIVARYLRYLKPIVIYGFCVEILAFGLMIRYRGAGASQGDLAAVQVVRGLGVGAISFPLQACIQSVTKHERKSILCYSTHFDSC